MLISLNKLLVYLFVSTLSYPSTTSNIIKLFTISLYHYCRMEQIIIHRFYLNFFLALHRSFIFSNSKAVGTIITLLLPTLSSTLLILSQSILSLKSFKLIIADVYLSARADKKSLSCFYQK